MNDKIIIRGARVNNLKNISKLIEICDIMHVYDNSGDKVKRIIRKHKDDISIFPNEIWDEKKILDLID